MGVFTKFGVRLLLALVLLCSCSIGYESDIDYSLMPVKQGDKWGYINAKGEYIINPQFDGRMFSLTTDWQEYGLAINVDLSIRKVNMS